jgi:hypothetical protein
MPAMISPHVCFMARLGYKAPPADMLPKTVVPASAPATKKIQTRNLLLPASYPQEKEQHEVAAGGGEA